MKRPQRILIIRPDRIGDVVLTTPLIRCMKKTFPDSFLAVMVHPSNTALLRNNPYVDVVLTDDSGKDDFWRKVKDIRTMKFDTALMPFPRERHAWMLFWAGIQKRIGVGHKLYEMMTLMKTVSRHKYIPLRHEADYMLDLARKLGASECDLKPELFLTGEEIASARKVLIGKRIDVSKPVVGVNPISKSSSPNWTTERYIECIRRISEKYQVVVNVAPSDDRGLQLFGSLEGSHIALLQLGLREHMAVCTLFSVLLSSSTGSMHIAAALGVPTVSLFCPLTACSPKLWGPLGNKASIILPSDAYCQLQCPKDPKICPLDDITVSAVVDRIDAVLQTSKHEPAR